MYLNDKYRIKKNINNNDKSNEDNYYKYIFYTYESL